MTPTKFSSSMMEKLRQERIQPKPKWFFWVQSLLIGCGGFVFLSIGAISAAIVILFVSDLQLLEIFAIGPWRGIKSLMIGLPVFWIIILVLLGILTSYLVQKSETGYRHSLWWWFGGILFFQILGGILLSHTSLVDRIENGMEHRIVRHQSMKQHLDEFWNRPEDGFIAGEVVDMSTDSFVLKADQNLWHVDMTHVHIHPAVQLQTNKKIRLVGDMIDMQHFKAQRIVPWKPPRKRRKTHRQSHENPKQHIFDILRQT